MSTQSPAYLALVLRGVFNSGAGAARLWFRDDNFVVDWTHTNMTSTNSTDGDVKTIRRDGVSTAFIRNSVFGDIPTTTFPRLVIRWRRTVGSFTPTIKVLMTDASEPSFSMTDPSTTWRVDDFALPGGVLIDRFQIGEPPNVNDAMEVDFVYVCKSSPLDITDKILTKSRSTLGKGARGSATLRLSNDKAFFWTSPNKINQGDVLLLWANDTGTPTNGFTKAHKIFGGVVRGLRGGVSREGKYATLTARPWGSIFDKATISRNLSGSADDTAVGDIVSDVNAQGWNFAYLLTDGVIVRTIQDVLGATIMNWQQERRSATETLEIFSDWLSARRTGGAELPSGTANRGCEWRVTPSEMFEWGVIDNFFGLDGVTRTEENEISTADLEELTDHIVNAVYLVGKVVMPVPFGDEYTETDAANWTGTNCTPADDAVVFYAGAKSIRLDATAGFGTFYADRSVTTVNIDTSKLGNKLFPMTVLVFVQRNNSNTATIYLRLLDSASTIRYTIPIPKVPDPGNWEQGIFKVLQTLTDIQKIRVEFASAGTTTAADKGYFDGLHIEGRIVALAYDNASIAAHGRSEIVVINNQAHERVEHRRIARGHLRKWNNSFFEGTVKLHGWYNPGGWTLPGNRLDMTLTDYNQTTKRYRIVEITHEFPYPLVTTIEVTDNLVTMETPKSAPTLRDALRNAGMTALADRETMDVKLDTIIGGIGVTSDEIGDALN